MEADVVGTRTVMLPGALSGYIPDRRLLIAIFQLQRVACTRARADANARGLLHTEARKLATTTHEVIRMKQWKMKMPRRKTDYQKLKQAAEAIGGGD